MRKGLASDSADSTSDSTSDPTSDSTSDSTSGIPVLQLISSSGFYGADNVLIVLAKGLKSTPFLPTVGVFENFHNPHLEVAKEAIRHGLPTVTFPCRGKLDIRTVFSIRRHLQKEKTGIIHTHGYKSNLYALAGSVGINIPRICTCHNWLGDDPKMRLYAWLDRAMLRKFDMVVAVSDSVRAKIVKQNSLSNRLMTILNGVNMDRFRRTEDSRAVRQTLGINKDSKVVGTVGRLSEEKGHVYLLRAAGAVLKTHRDIVFLVVGDGPLKQNLQTTAAQLLSDFGSSPKDNWKPFVFTGARSDVAVLYSIMDVFVLPSLTEGLPMALLEAMAAGTPVVATSVGAVPTVIENSHSGLLTEPGDAAGLAAAILGLLSDPTKANRMAEQAYDTVQRRFSSKFMTENYIDLYHKLLASQPRVVEHV